MMQDVHDLTAPYALDALDAHERARYEAHLEHCEACRDELTGFRLTGVRLADAETATPPPALRERLLAEVSRTSQERPVVTQLAQHGRLRRTAPRLLVAAAVLTAVASVGGYLAERDRSADLRAETAQVTQIVGAGDATTIDSTVSTGGSVRVVTSAEHDAAVVMGTGLKQLDDDHVYQVWAMHDGVPRSAGLLGREAGMVYVSDLGGADGFAVTVEPDGGSPGPTTDPVAAMSA